MIIDGKFEGTKLRQEQINCLVENYPWQLDGGKYVLRSGVSEGDLEVIRGVFQQFLSYQRDRSSFFFRSEALTRKLAGVSLNDFLDAGEVERQKLADLKREIVAHGLQWFEYDDLESFGSMVGGSLWKRIEKESGEGVVEEDKEWLEVEAEFHELFIKDRTRHFVGRRDLLDRMRSFCEREGEPPVMMVTGDPGIGKSALMARFSEEIAHSHPDWLIISHFVGASPGSTSLRETLLRLCTCLQQAHDSSDDMPETTTGLIHLLPRLLYKVTRDRKVLIVLDALNQFDATDDAHAMLWLPQQLPDNTKFVLSTLQGDAADALLFRRIQPRVLESPGLNREEVEALVSSYLRDIRHEFPNKEIEAAFLRKLSAGSPLYALVALEELRVFGRFAELEDRIDELPETVPALFDQVLSRIETDFSEALVRKCMSYIACGRQGMTAEELQELLAPHALERGTSSLAGRLPDMTWARLYRACGPYLFERSGVIDFFHGQFKEAVGKRYLREEDDRRNSHKIIADYFGRRWPEGYTRAVDELPHQLTKAADWKAVERVLCDLKFIEEKCVQGMAWKLVNDYDLLGLGESDHPLVQTAWHGHASAHPTDPGNPAPAPEGTKEYGLFCPFCLAWNPVGKEHLGSSIPCPSCRTPLKINPFVVEANWCPSGPRKIVARRPPPSSACSSEKLATFADFVRRNVHVLSSFPTLTLQQAANEPDNSPVAQAAASALESPAASAPWIRWLNKPQRKPSELLTILGLPDPNGYVHDCDYSPDGSRIVSASSDNAVRVWDAGTGELIHLMEEHANSVRACVYSPDGTRIVSASSDSTVKIWDAETGRSLMTLKNHSAGVESCDYSPDGRWIAAGGSSRDNTLRVWDAESGKPRTSLTSLPSAPGDLWSTGKHVCTYSPDGSRILIASGFEDSALWICDAITGKVLTRFEGHGHHAQIKDAAFSPDGRRVISCSGTGPLKVWDATTGEFLTDLPDSSGYSKVCGFSPDGTRIAAGSHYLYLWDAESYKILGALGPYPHFMGSCRFSPNGRTILTVHKNTLKISDATALDTARRPGGKSCSIHLCRRSPDTKSILAASSFPDRTLRICDAETQRKTMELDGHKDTVVSAAYSPDGDRIVTGSYEKDATFKIWDAKTGATLHTISLPEPSLHGKEGVSAAERTQTSLIRNGKFCDYLPGGRDVLLSFWGPYLRVIDGNTGRQRFALAGFHGWVRSVTFSPDGMRVAAAWGTQLFGETSRDKLNVWDLGTAEVLCSIEVNLDSCAYSPDGRYMVSVSNGTKLEDPTLRIWDMRSVSILRTSSAPLATRTLFFSPDGCHIVSGGADGILYLWDAMTCEAVGRLMTGEEIKDAAVSKGGTRIIAANSEEQLRIFEPRGVNLGPPFATAARLYLHREQKWNSDVTARCQWCGCLFVPDRMVLQVIHSLTNHLTPGRSPCAELGDDAWEERKLLSECPSCHHPLRFNPFLVDNDEGPEWELFKD